MVDAVEMDPSLVETARQFLAGTNPGALAADMPEMRSVTVPEDDAGLAGLLRALEEARGVFDRRFGDGLTGAVNRLSTAVTEVRAADAAPVSPDVSTGRPR